MWGKVDNFSNFTASINLIALQAERNESILRKFRSKS